MSKRMESLESELGLRWTSLFKSHGHRPSFDLADGIAKDLVIINKKINILVGELGKEFTSELRLVKKKKKLIPS